MDDASEERICEHCGKAFPLSRKNRCCSEACRKERRLLYMRAYMRDYMRAAVRKPTYQRVAEKKPMGVGLARTVVCTECKTSVETRVNSAKVTCSKRCSQLRMNRIVRERRARKKLETETAGGGEQENRV